MQTIIAYITVKTKPLPESSHILTVFYPKRKLYIDLWIFPEILEGDIREFKTMRISVMTSKSRNFADAKIIQSTVPMNMTPGMGPI